MINILPSLSKTFVALQLAIILPGFLYSQENQEVHAKSDLHLKGGHLNPVVYQEYQTKTNALLSANHIGINSFLVSATGTEENIENFKKFLGPEINYDLRELVISVGENHIKTSKELVKFIDSKRPKYKLLHDEFINQQNNSASANRAPSPFSPGRAPGQPCQNMDFESQTLTGWVGSYGSSCDPVGIAGFNNLGVNSGTGQHTIMTGGTDPNIPAISCVMPGGTASVRLGDNGGGWNWAARISQTFQVQAANPYFTYNYAVILEDAGHVLSEQPYFRIRMYDGAGGIISCATLDVDATNAPGLINAGGVKYRDWTQVVIPLTTYIGQNVTIEFTTADCNNGPPSGGSHDGYAYIDCSCVPPQIFTSSPTICGGTSINVTAPSGLSSYSWTGPGIVGANNTQTISVNQAGTYTVTMQTNTTPPNLPCTFSLDTIIPGNPASPIAQFASNVVCTGSATVFTDQSTPIGSINAWAWDFDNNGTTDNSTQNPSYIFPSAGTFPVTLIVTWGACTDNFVANVTVNPGVTPTITPAGPFCENAAAVNMVGNPAGGTWSGTGITNASVGTFTPSNSVVGSNTITYTVSGSCAGAITSTVVVNPLPVSEAGPVVSICSGSPASIGTSSTAGYTYSWLPATGLSAANVSNPSITTINSGSTPIVTTYTVTTTTNSCSTTDTVTVIVNPLPVLAITNPAPVCSPNTVDITLPAVTAGSTGGGTFSYWTDAAGTIGLAAPTAITTSGTYYIKVTGTGGCTDIDPVMITVNPLPVSDAGSDVTICSGVAASIGTVSVAGNSYSWSPAAGLNASNVSNPSITTTNPGTAPIVTTYTVTTTTTSTGCTSTDDVTVTVNPQPVLTITDPAAVCSPNSVDITVPAVTSGSTGGGTMSYWMDVAGTIGLAAPTAVAASGTYYIKVTATGGCTDIDPVVVTINPLPVSDAGADVSVCTGVFPVIGTNSIAGYSYAWLPATGLTAANVSNPGITTTNSGAAPIVTTYTVTTTISATGCTSIDETVVTIDPLPVLAITDPSPVCFPATVDITAAAITAGTVGSGTFSYWTDAAASIALMNPLAVTVSGTYYIKIITGAGCTDIDPVNVTINPLPVSDAGTDLQICTGSSGSVGSASAAGFAYQWLPATGLSSDIVSNPTVTLTNLTLLPVSTTYTVTTINNTTGCQSSDSVLVTVYPVATANAGSTQSVCSGTSLILGGAIGGSASGGTWGGGTGTYSPDNSTLNAVYTPSAAEYAAGTVTLTLTTNDPAGPCAFASSSVTFYFYPNPVVDFAVNDREGCPVHCVNFTDLSSISGGETIVSWDWDFGDDSLNSNLQNPSHCYPLTALYDITLTVTSNHGCSSDSTQVQMIEVFATPEAEFTAVPNPASVLNPLVTLNNGSSSDVVYWDYYFGDGEGTSPNTPSPEHMYPSSGPGIYTATLIVHNADNCWDTVQHDIEIGPEFTFFIPNAFTPNGDGVNDYFYGQGIGIEEYDIYIFDRWGNMIYHGDNIYTSLWDGKANAGSEVAQQDVYVWKVKLTDVFGKKHNYIGTVTLVK
jgi:gliding motility-associated-like protein